jgi:DNA polymerase-3 subunit delta
MALTFANLSKQLKAKEFASVYLLHGEEAYYIDRALELIVEHALAEHERDFNQSIFYGRDADSQSIIDAARQYPAFAERRLVVLKEAQQMRDFDKLLPYLEHAVPSTVLVLAYMHKKYPANRKLYKAAAKKGQVFESKKIRDYQVAAWVTDYFKGSQYKISPQAAQLLQEYVGPDLARLHSELEKLLINLEPGATVGPKQIEEYIGISKDHNIFELQQQLLKGDQSRAWKIIENFRSNPKEHPFFMITGSLYGLYNKLYLTHMLQSASDKELASALRVNPFFIRDYRSAVRIFPIPKIEAAFSLLLEYDMRAKGVNDTGTAHGELLREMMWRLMN